jgi:hypothetical protein
MTKIFAAAEGNYGRSITGPVFVILVMLLATKHIKGQRTLDFEQIGCYGLMDPTRHRMPALRSTASGE